MGVGSGKRGAAPTRRDATRRGGVSRSSSRRRRPSRRVLSGAPCASREPSASHAKRVNLFTREADRRTRGACTFVRGRFSLIDRFRSGGEGTVPWGRDDSALLRSPPPASEVVFFPI